MEEEGERQMDRHTMQSEVGYLLSELWKGREKGRRAERERKKRERRERGREKRVRREVGKRQKLHLGEGDGKEREFRLELKISLP